MTAPLALPFPMPDTTELARAYRELNMAVNGDDATKKKIGDPGLLPRPWDPPTCNKPALRAELWVWLDAVVTWFNHEYVWDPAAGMIPPCWPQHPHLVHEIAVLADQRRRAALDPTSSSLEEWHRYGAPNFLDRMRKRMKNGCDEHHQAWPAQGRFERHIGRVAKSARGAVFAST
ncbi:MAG: hypothetical protein IT193_13005 [Propionibacteriaceae bacterium]|nr:hypothetical protein [Propionibacteriaceae bacterium]